MKKRMMTFSQFPLFLRFSVRMLCFTVFFIVTFIRSQTPFYHSDSTIFISGDAYMYVEFPVEISAANSLSDNNKAVEKFTKSKHKAFSKLNAPAANNNHISSSNQVCFTIPKSSHYVGNFSNALSTAVLANSFQIKQYQKMTGSAFWILPKVIASEKKLLYPLINHFNLLKIITNHFSRPPPVTIRSTKVF